MKKFLGEQTIYKVIICYFEIVIKKLVGTA